MLFTVLLGWATIGPANHGAFDPVVKRWLASHPLYRQLEDKDCHCEEELLAVRTQSRGAWRANPDYHPYVMRGDFNGDGRADEAVVVEDQAKTRQRRVLILTARPDKPPRPYLSPPLSGTAALFFGEPRPKPHRLLVGEFEAEGQAFMPSTIGSYRLR